MSESERRQTSKFTWKPGDIEIESEGKDWKDEGEKNKSKHPATHVGSGYEGVDWDNVLH